MPVGVTLVVFIEILPFFVSDETGCVIGLSFDLHVERRSVDDNNIFPDRKGDLMNELAGCHHLTPGIRDWGKS
jgi:hypothetical protein